MALRIAIAGKGGVGKTTLAALLARLYARKGLNVIAVDADPASSLAAAFGVPADVRTRITPLSQMYDLIEERTGVRPGASFGSVFKLNPKVDDILERYGVTCSDGVKLLVLGSIQSAGSGCFCPESALLKNLLRHLFLKKGDVLIMDMEAGLEHLGRGTAERVDMLLTVVEPGLRSIETSGRIKELAGGLRIKELGAVLNKARTREDAALAEDRLGEYGIPLLGVVPYDDAISRSDLDGTAVDPDISEDVKRAMTGIMERVASTANIQVG